MRRPSLIAALVGTCAVLLTGAVAWYLTPTPGDPLGITRVAGPSQGPIDVGGPFELTAHTGQTVTQASFAGKLLLVFFGYTFCPDVCPTTLNRVALALDELGPEAEKVQPLFITVDPARDTAAVLADYVAAFHPAIVGLTGTPQQIAVVAKSYRAYFSKVEPKGSDPEDYLMDHSVLIYLIGEDGKFLTMFSHTASPEDIAAGIKKYLSQATS